MSMLRASFPVLMLAASSALALDVTADSAFQLGPDRWWSDVTTLTVSPAQEALLVLSAGRSGTATPVADRAESYGAAVSGEIASRVTVTAGWIGYTGFRSRIWDGGTLARLGEAAGHERHVLYSLDLAVRVYEAAEGEEPDGNAFLKAVSLMVGGTEGTHRCPFEVRNPPAGATPLPAEARVRERTLTAGVTAEMEANTVSVTAARHSYAWPAGIDRGLVNGLFGTGPDAVAAVFAGLPDWGVTASYRESLPWQGASVTVAYAYTRLAAPSGLARTITAELGWSPVRLLSVRGGCLWLRQSGATTRFARCGISLFF